MPETSPAVRHLLHAAADIFVSPADNIQETMGITPLKAMACGVPQAVSNWDGYRDLVGHGQTGFLIDTGSASRITSRPEVSAERRLGCKPGARLTAE